MRASIACLSVVLLVAFGTGWTWAAPKEGSVTLTRSSDEITIRAGKGSGRKIPGGWENVFERGKEKQVEVQQGDLIMNCDRLTVVYEDEKGNNPGQNPKTESMGKLSGQRHIKSIVAAGDVTITQGDRKAKAGKALYDNLARTITLSEKPRLWWDGNMVEADVFILYLDQKSYKTGGDGPVRMKILPTTNRREKQK